LEDLATQTRLPVSQGESIDVTFSSVNSNGPHSAVTREHQPPVKAAFAEAEANDPGKITMDVFSSDLSSEEELPRFDLESSEELDDAPTGTSLRRPSLAELDAEDRVDTAVASVPRSDEFDV